MDISIFVSRWCYGAQNPPDICKYLGYFEVSVDCSQFGHKITKYRPLSHLKIGALRTGQKNTKKRDHDFISLVLQNEEFSIKMGTYLLNYNRFLIRSLLFEVISALL